MIIKCEKGGNIMNAQKLSKRLETVASFVPKKAVVADIGSDHAYLPCYLIHNNIATRAIAGEVAKGPFEAAVKQVKEEGLKDKITVRFANGLHAIHEQDGVDTITIAGMGGPLIVSILNDRPEILTTVSRLILQPNIHAKVIREWAIENGWKITNEVILEEDEKIYEILVLHKGTQQLTEVEMLLGPYLLKEQNEAFVQKWKREVQNWNNVLQSMEKAQSTDEISQKKQQLMHLIELVEEVL